MAEIKKPLIAQDDGGFLITEDHTLKDILRHVLGECGADELLYLAKEVAGEG